MLLVAVGCALLVEPPSIFDRGTVVDGRVIAIATVFSSSIVLGQQKDYNPSLLLLSFGV